MVIEQKTLKIEGELENLQKQETETTRKLKNLNIELAKLNAQLFEKRKCHETEEMECEFSHSVLVDQLKSAEMSVLHLEQALRDCAKEVELTKQRVMEKHREALSWETKWKMAQETRKYLQDEYAAASDIGVMRAEIHRMEVRYGQLKRAQEKLVHDMENCVQHREHIFDEANVRGKMPDSKTKSRFTIQHRLNDMRNKYKHVNMEAVAIERNIGDLMAEQDDYLAECNKLTQDIEHERIQDSMLQNEIEQAGLLKQQVIEINKILLRIFV